jgi:hypothetical protein
MISAALEQSSYGKKRGGGDGMRIIERIPAHYEVEEVTNLGRSYRWCPEQIVVECGQCTERMAFSRSKLLTSILTCECGARSTAGIREDLLVEQLQLEDEVAHPWRYWRSREESGIPV